jgi:predicted RecA/RadA family phage recombinase
MKKFLVVSLMLVLVSGFVAAQELGVTTEVTGKYNIVNSTGYQSSKDVEEVPKNYREGLAGAVPFDGALTFKAEGEGAGVEIGLDLGYLFQVGDDNNRPWNGDNKAAVWFKPFKNDLLTLKAGAKPSDSTLRYGNLSSEPLNILGDWGRIIVEDYISGFGGEEKSPYALILTSAPIENLFIGLGWRTLLTGATYPDGKYAKPGTPALGDNYLALQLGVGYTIENVGSARAQFVAPYPFAYDGSGKNETNGTYGSAWDFWYGGPDGDTLTIIKDSTKVKEIAGLVPGSKYGLKFNSIQAGFKVTALDSIGLNFDIVAKIPLPVTAKFEAGENDYTVTLGAPPKFGVVAQFVTGNFSVNAGIGLALGYVAYESDQKGVEPVKNDAVEFILNAEPAIKISDSLTLGADIAFVVDAGQKSGFVQDDVFFIPKKASDTDTKLGAPVDLGLGVFLHYTIGAGTLTTGFSVVIPNLGGLDYNDTSPDNKDWSNPNKFVIPLQIKVAF